MTKTRIGLSFSKDDLERLRALQEILNTRNRSETVSIAVKMTLALRTDPVGSLAAAGVHFETPVSIEIRKDPHQVVVRCPQNTQERKMFTLQFTSGAFLSNEDVPSGQWRDGESFASYATAREALRQCYADMRERCGTGWDCNYRIVSDRDVQMTTQFLCPGHIDSEAWPAACPHQSTRTIRWTWLEGPQERRPDATGYDGRGEYIPITVMEQAGPDGDWEDDCCPDCARMQGAEDDRIYDSPD